MQWGVTTGHLPSERRQALAPEDNGIIGSSVEGPALIIAGMYYMSLTQCSARQKRGIQLLLSR